MRLAFLLAILATQATAQSSGAPDVALPNAASSDDVIVTALRIPREKLPTGVYWNYQSIFPSRIRYENAQMFVRCALKSSDAALIRKVVDGEPNSAPARFAQGWIAQTHRGCYPPVQTAGFTQANTPTSTIDYGWSVLDRGAIVENVLHRFSPDAALTREMTADPSVRNRFRAREGYRNRHRLPNDRDALIYTSCLVEQQPVLATRLVRSEPGSKLEQGLTQAIIVEGRACLGNTRRVTIDPTVARTYIVDAFYRWVVAARDVDSLVPAG